MLELGRRGLAVLSYARANTLVGQLVDIGVLRQFDDAVYDREFTARTYWESSCATDGQQRLVSARR